MLPASPPTPDQETCRFYVDALRRLDDAGLPYVVGGGYAMAHYTGIVRDTKDLDIFVRECDHEQILQALADGGYRTEYFYPFWIAKALCGERFIDILYNSGNGLCPVDDEWFQYGIPAEVHGYSTRLVPVEEQLWSKAFVQDRNRYDGADVAHLLLCCADHMDWERLIRRFSGHEPVLLSHLILFRYIYPGDADRIPQWVFHRLEPVVKLSAAPGSRVCNGPNVAQRSYVVDVEKWGYADGRVRPNGPLTQDQVDQMKPR